MSKAEVIEMQRKAVVLGCVAAAYVSVCFLMYQGLCLRACAESVEILRDVEGIVTDEQGRSLEGAEVILLRSVANDPRRRKRTVLTDAEGKFRFAILGRGMVRVHCEGLKGWRTRVGIRFVTPESEPLRYVLRKDTGNDADFTPLEREVVISGRVVDLQGRGVADANILGLGKHLKGAHCMSAEDGRFELRRNVTAGWGNVALGMMLYVNKPETRQGVVRRVTFNERWEYDVTIEIKSYRRICSSLVVDDNGSAMAGVDVLRRNHMVGMGMKWEMVAKTDENGKYEVLDLISGMTYSFCGLSEVYGTVGSKCVWWSKGRYSLKPIVVVARDKVLRGVAVDHKGRVVGGAKVSVVPCAGALAEVWTNEEGRFRIGGLVSGQFELRGDKMDPRVHGGRLTGSQKCMAEEKDVKLVLSPLPDLW